MTTETPKDRRARETIEALTQQLAEVRAGRDALAARINRLVNAGDELADELGQWSLTEQHDETDAAFRSWREARDQPAATSLARRDAEQRARALEEAAEHTTPAMHKMAEWLRSRARWIRKHGTETGA